MVKLVNSGGFCIKIDYMSVILLAGLCCISISIGQEWESVPSIEGSNPSLGYNYLSQQPTGYGSALEETQLNMPMQASASGGSQNSFWITSIDGSNFWRSMNIPVFGYAREILTPSSSGNLILEERNTNGHVKSYNVGYVTAYRTYRLWFFADTPGIHQQRYRIDNGPASSVLTFNVGNQGHQNSYVSGFSRNKYRDWDDHDWDDHDWDDHDWDDD